ncbi:WhiB family transcriptional regulator [Speluncibacter jeojiensis]|uniref:Transcriptional regulator WhiB n=1 Tax=Speluncibacter jeojiensis TaxID=2710754 RepID=A0A9X4LWP1_9ACTN|nr:WhiB family transcriptional regulator [Corynebacteriales bacterium D3-21]
MTSSDRGVLRQLLKPIDSRWEWQVRGRCRDANSAIFFSAARETRRTRHRREEQAKKVCDTCPVRAQCLNHALTVREPFGVWGGLTEGERRRIYFAASA